MELRPCPFCGGEVTLSYDTQRGGQHVGTDPIYVGCDQCGQMLYRRYPSVMRTKNHWNARPIEDALASDLAALRKENASLHEANEIDLGEKAPLIFQITELRARLGEAEEAIRWMHGYDVPGAPMFPFSSEPGNRYAWRGISRELPGVQRALKGAS